MDAFHSERVEERNLGMRKQIITMMVSFAALFLLTSFVCASPVSGGWSITADTTITPEVQEVFDKAMESFTGAGYEPVNLLATQVVAGTNYCFLCRGTVVKAFPALLSKGVPASFLTG